MDLLSDIIEEPKIARIGYRISAAIIDFIVIWLAGFVVRLLFGVTGPENEGLNVYLTGIPAALWFLIIFALMPVQEGLTGKTIGKRVVRIKVVREDFSAGSVGRSIARHLFDAVDMMFCVGIIIAAVTVKKQRIGDLVAKTIVVVD
jgi:uncharacterized RDD family membrane protein YckC